MTRLVASGVAILGVSLLAVLGSDRAGKVYASQNGSASPDPYAQVGDSAAGKEFWNGYECAHCHGLYGQGGYGPDLAGLGLTFDQFKHQVRQSWGIMPRWSEKQISDKELGNVFAFLTSLPRVETPGVPPPGVPPDISNRRVGENNIGRPSRVTAPPNAPLGQRYAVNLAGCAQCHGPEQRSSREEMGSRTHPRYKGRDLAQLVKDTTGFTGSEEAVTWEYFKACVYDHERLVPDARMGTYSRARLPEPVVREIYNFAISLGTRARLVNELAPGVRSGDTVSYTLTVTNLGKKHGMQPEDVSVELVLDQGVKVVRAMGNGYQGVQRHPLSGRDVAVWKVPTIKVDEPQDFTLVVSGPRADQALLTIARQAPWSPTSGVLAPGVHSRVHWAKPTTREFPNMVKDARRPPEGDHIPIIADPPPQPRVTQQQD